MPARRLSLATALSLLPVAAFAHTGLGDTSGFTHGFLHPVTGIDHVLAMVMVGAFAWQRGGAARWCLPVSFVALMVTGAALGMVGVAVPFVELGIALSVVVLGAVVAMDATAPVALAMAVVGLFALFHGHAHGAEIPEAAGGFAYGAGFVAATALLHGAGLAGGALLSRPLARFAGAAAGLAGMALLVALA